MNFDKRKFFSQILATWESHAENLAQTMMQETGKTIRDARIEVNRAKITTQATLEALAEFEKVRVIKLPADALHEVSWHYTPIGTVLAITPFNFPLNLVAHKVLPALAAGNTVILKPAPRAPKTAELFAQILFHAGLPQECLSVIHCSNEETEKMVQDEHIHCVSFTGSAQVGWHLRSIAGAKKVILELGGLASALVCADADLQSAIPALVKGSFGNAGQSCISTQRIFVDDKIFAKLSKELVIATQKLRLGEPSDESSDLGSLISEDAAKRVETWINEAVAKGATVLCGGKRSAAFIEPTVLSNVSHDTRLYTDEVFAPVVFLEPFNDFSAVIAQLNAEKYGLSHALWTKDEKKIAEAIQTLQVGQLVINDSTALRYDVAPYGGIKASGLGREGPLFAMQELSEIKTVLKIKN